MATGNSVHDEVKEQQQKLKGKPFKEKWAYFWEYYKIQTIVVIAVLAFAGNLIYTFATRKDTVMEAAFVNCYMNTKYAENYRDDIRQDLRRPHHR